MLKFQYKIDWKEIQLVISSWILVHIHAFLFHTAKSHPGDREFHRFPFFSSSFWVVRKSKLCLPMARPAFAFFGLLRGLNPLSYLTHMRWSTRRRRGVGTTVHLKTRHSRTRFRDGTRYTAAAAVVNDAETGLLALWSLPRWPISNATSGPAGMVCWYRIPS